MSDTAEILANYEVEKTSGTTLARVLIRFIRHQPLGTAGGIIVLLFVFTAIFADFLAPYGFNDVAPPFRLKPPSQKYLMGTDHLGRDVLSRTIYGARISVVVGLSTAVVALVISTILGVLTGYMGGKLDMAMQRFVDAWMCFPMLIFLMIMISLVGPGHIQVILCLGLHWGIIGSRAIRGPVISIRENVYVAAANSIGASNFRIMWKHILPNVIAVIIIIFSTNIPAIIMTEAALSFLGLGIPPPLPSWGGMLSGSARTYMMEAPWMGIWPGVALALLVYGANMFGDAMRDVLDPRLRGGGGGFRLVKEKKS